jgi:hypothetical protein
MAIASRLHGIFHEASAGVSIKKFPSSVIAASVTSLAPPHVHHTPGELEVNFMLTVQ